MMLKIIWTAGFMSLQGPIMKDLHEPDRFKDMAACDAFGERMAKRTEDFVRGALNVTWETPVMIVWRCEPVGDPA